MSRIAFALWIGLLVGCETRVYDIRLEPTSAGLQRTLTVWKEKQGQDANVRVVDAELDRLKPLYAEQLSATGDVRQSFRGTFAERMPGDVGGHGSYKAVVTPAGSGHWYLERFRGTTDPDGELYDRRAAVDRFADLIVGWFDEQLKDKPHHGHVHRFLHQEFRQDLRNTALYLWLAAGDDNPQAVIVEKDDAPHRLPDAMIAAAQYLFERGYVDSASTLSIGFANSAEPVDQLRAVRKLLAAKSGLDANDADALFPFLVDVDAAKKSWDDYLRTTPEYARKKKAWQFDPEKPQETDGPAPSIVVDDLLAQAVTTDVFDDRDELRLSLVVPTAPHETNGDFESAGKKEPGGRIAWHKHLHGRRELPTVCYASWAVADERFQTAHFGKVALEGAALAKFAGYFGQLPKPQQEEFAAHLKSLEPGDALRGRVRDFRFTTTKDAELRHLGEQMLDVLYEAL